MALCLLTPCPAIAASSSSLDLSHSMPSCITIFHMGIAASARDSCFHPQEVILCVSCDTVISVLLKTLKTRCLPSFDNIPGMPFPSMIITATFGVWILSSSFSVKAPIYGGPKDNPSILRTSICRMFLCQFGLKISPSFPAFKVLAEILYTINDKLIKYQTHM